MLMYIRMCVCVCVCVCACVCVHAHTHNSQKQGWETFSVKGQIINIFGCAGHMICVTAI